MRLMLWLPFAVISELLTHPSDWHTKDLPELPIPLLILMLLLLLVPC